MGHKNCARVARPSLHVLVMQYSQYCEGVVWFTRLPQNQQ